MEQRERLVSDEEMDELLNYGPDYYQKAGSPPLVFADGPAHDDDLLSRGQLGSVKYCGNGNDSAESLPQKVFSALLGQSGEK